MTAFKGSRGAALYALFGASGAVGLAYEVLWVRQFLPLFGGTTLATAAVLSAFFLGTSAGSLVLGAYSRRWSRPLVAFGLLEVGVGVGALLVRPILAGYSPMSAALYESLSPHPLGFAFVKLLLAIVAVGLPTFFMGGTLPALGEATAPSGRRLGVSVGGLYAINLLGAAVGALAVPYLLLPRLGIRGAYEAAVAGSLTLGAAGCALGFTTGRKTENAVLAHEPPSEGESRLGLLVVFLLAAWSGLVTLGLEVLWTRMLSLVHENSVYSFAVVSVVFLLGLGGGAALARQALRRGISAERLLGWAWASAGVLVVASPRVFFGLTDGLESLSAEPGSAASGQLLRVAGLALFPACVCLGTALPLLMEMAGRDRTFAGPLLGRLLAINTAGAIAGPLLVTFVVAPWLGLWKSIVALGCLTVLAASRAGLTRGERWGSWIALGAILGMAQPTGLPPARVRAAQGEKLVSAREGSYGTTAVVEDDHDRWITVNNSYVLGGAAAAGEQRWQGHLPLLLHPSPRRVAFLGLGTGITAGSALLHPVEKVTALELVPDVVTAARDDFGDLNGHLISDPRVTVVADDGRNYLASRRDAFDVIVGDLLVPWRPTESALYTKEHFEAVRRALSAEGLFCQWLPLYQLSEDQLAVLVRTFLEVFPQTTVWRGNFLPEEPTLALVGHRDGRTLDVAGVDGRALALAPKVDERNPFLRHPAGLWLHLVGAPRLSDPEVARARQNRDDEPWVELLSSRGERPCVGAPLATFLEGLSRSTAEGSLLSSLDGEHRAWQDRGMALARASLRRGPSGEQTVLSILRTLPEDLQRSLGAR